MVTDLVELIRKEYSQEVTIILRLDSGFLDERNLLAFDKLGIGFICSGKMLKGVKDYVRLFLQVSGADMTVDIRSGLTLSLGIGVINGNSFIEPFILVPVMKVSSSYWILPVPTMSF